MTSLLDHRVRAADGTTLALRAHAGRVLLVVNVASRCGFTPQYAGLQALHTRYEPRGLTVLGFPCNQFASQEPGDAQEIATFCRTSYDVSFPILAKIEVNGSGADPFWQALKRAQPGLLGIGAIKWNFTKFLLDRAGEAVARFAPTVRPDALERPIERLLDA